MVVDIGASGYRKERRAAKTAPHLTIRNYVVVETRHLTPFSSSRRRPGSMSGLDTGLRRDDRRRVRFIKCYPLGVSPNGRPAPARCFPKSHRPFIPQAGLGQIIPRKVGDLAVRSSHSDLQSGVAVNSLCRHALSKDATGQVFATRQTPFLPSTKPRRAEKILEG